MTDYKDQAVLTEIEMSTIAVAFGYLEDSIAANNYEKGWRGPGDEPRNMGELIALLHSEVSEAFEAYRNNEPQLWYEHDVVIHGEDGVRKEKSGPTSGFADQASLTTMLDGAAVLGKPQGIASELADVLIRIFDMADENEIPLAEAVIAKHAYNQTRPWKHGGKAV